MKKTNSKKKVLKSALPRYPKLSAALKRRLTRAKPAPIKRTLGSKSRQVRRHIFHAKIFANTRLLVIKELEWFIEQLKLDADGGGTNDRRIDSDWSIDRAA